MGKKIWLFMHARNFGCHVTVRPSARPPVLPSASQGNQCEMIRFPVSRLQPVFNMMINADVRSSWPPELLEKEKQQQQSRVLTEKGLEREIKQRTATKKKSQI